MFLHCKIILTLKKLLTCLSDKIFLNLLFSHKIIIETLELNFSDALKPLIDLNRKFKTVNRNNLWKIKLNNFNLDNFFLHIFIIKSLLF